MTFTGSDTFRAFVARTNDSQFERGVVSLTLGDLPTDGVLIDVAWSGVNYKDALAATANGRVARISPLVVGIDLAGHVIESDVDWLAVGQPVIAHGYELGVSRHGGFAERARVPAEWVVPLPDGLTLREAMTIGTPGFTAALSVEALESDGLTPGTGPILVTGASGGVGSLAVSILARRGYEVAASSGKPSARPYLRRLGASTLMGRLGDTTLIDRTDLVQPPKPLSSARWAGAIDCVGGAALAHVLPSLSPGAAVAASGNTGGADLHTSVLPFILRGVSLLGIDSVNVAIEDRRRVWQRLATDLRPSDIAAIGHEISLEDLDGALDAIGDGGVTGRLLVRIGA
jgi:acrylyl-CoA reductase (NADPH)